MKKFLADRLLIDLEMGWLSYQVATNIHHRKKRASRPHQEGLTVRDSVKYHDRVLRDAKKRHPYVVEIGRKLLIDVGSIQGGRRYARHDVESEKAASKRVREAWDWCQENFGPNSSMMVEKRIRGRLSYGYDMKAVWSYEPDSKLGECVGHFYFLNQRDAAAFKIWWG